MKNKIKFQKGGGDLTNKTDLDSSLWKYKVYNQIFF